MHKQDSFIFIKANNYHHSYKTVSYFVINVSGMHFTACLHMPNLWATE